MEGRIDVEYVARLARLNLSRDERQLFEKQLGDVLAEVEKLKEVDVSEVEAAAHAVPMFDVWREDEARDCFTTAEALANAPRSADGLFIVAKVME